MNGEIVRKVAKGGKGVWLLLLAALCLGLGGCAHENASMRFYGKVKSKDPKTGIVSERTALLASLAGEMPGLKKVTVGNSIVEFDEDAKGTETTQILDKDGKVVSIITRDVLPGFYAAPTITAQGDANKKAIDAGGAAGTGIALSTFGPPALGKAGAAVAAPFAR